MEVFQEVEFVAVTDRVQVFLVETNVQRHLSAATQVQMAPQSLVSMELAKTPCVLSA